MRRLLQVVSAAALAGTVLPSASFLAGRADLDQAKLMTLIASLVWFVVTPLWMGQKDVVWKRGDTSEPEAVR